MTTDATLPSVLLHGGFALFLLAYALRDILWLRVVTTMAYVLFSVLAVVRGGMALVELLPWYVAFVTINGLQTARLVHERWLIRLDPDEERLWTLAFPALDRVVFKRFMRLGQWRTLNDGFVLTTEGRRSLRFYLVADGEVHVTLAGREVAILGPGQFVGEIGFIANRRATATTVARIPKGEGARTRCVVWNVPKLRKQMERDEELRSLVFAAVGSDLAHKIAAQTAAAQRGDGAPVASPLRPPAAPAPPEPASSGVTVAGEVSSAAG